MRADCGVNGCCLLADGTLAVATASGGSNGGLIELYNRNGVLKQRLTVAGVTPNGSSPLVNVIRQGTGFIVVQPRALVFFKDTKGAGVPFRTLTGIIRVAGGGRQTIPFQEIVDVAINSQQV